MVAVAGTAKIAEQVAAKFKNVRKAYFINRLLLRPGHFQRRDVQKRRLSPRGPVNHSPTLRAQQNQLSDRGMNNDNAIPRLQR